MTIPELIAEARRNLARKGYTLPNAWRIQTEVERIIRSRNVAVRWVVPL